MVALVIVHTLEFSLWNHAILKETPGLAHTQLPPLAPSLEAQSLLYIFLRSGFVCGVKSPTAGMS